MWNKFKELIEWKDYNTLSSYYLYFLEAYSGSEIKYKATVNVCELTRKTIKAFLGVSIAFLLAFCGAYSLLMYGIAVALFINFGYDIAQHAELPMIVFGVYSGMLILILSFYSLEKFNEWRRELRNKKNHERRLQEEFEFLNPELVKPKIVKPKSIFVQWYEAFNNKFCVQVDLNKFRPENKKRDEDGFII